MTICSTRFSHSCSVAQLGYALQPDSCIYALQHIVWLRTSTRFLHSCPATHSLVTHFNQILAFMPCNTELGLRTSTRFSNSCPAIQSLVTHFNQILAFMPCNTEFDYALQPDSRIHALQHRVWLRTSTRFSNSCPAIQSLVTYFNQILEFMPCNAEFGYALQPDSWIHALQYRVWLRTSTRFSNSCPATHSLVTRYDDITITSID
jgi:hypothetical protein